jgi:phosphoglucosamine mutase
MGVLFGTDGIRGEANRYPMDAGTAFAVGQAITQVLKRNGHAPVVIIGKDTRISGYMLESALESGVTSMGGMTYLVGVMPTPAMAYLTESMRADAGGPSAPYNPYHDNGLWSPALHKLDEQEAEIEALSSASLPEMVLRREGWDGQVLEDALALRGVLKNTFPRDCRSRVSGGHDVANGATYKVAPAVLPWGADVTVIHNVPTIHQRRVWFAAYSGPAADGQGHRLSHRARFRR